MRGFKLGFGFGYSSGGGAAGWIGYLLNALGFNTGSTAQTLTAPDPNLALDWEGTLTDFGSATNSDSVAVSAIPGSRLSGGVVYDDDGSGNPLHPSVTTGGVTDYAFYPTHEVSTAYASDKFVWAEASDGSTRYYSSSGGTSAASAPTFPTSGTVVDNDITWTYEGRYGLSGQRVEGAATQYLLNSETPATQTTGSLAIGDYVLWMEGTGSADLTTGTATISTTGSATDGTPLTFSVTVEGTVTVTVAGNEDRIQLEGGDFPTSIIQSVASTVTRSAVNLTIPTSETGLTAAEGAGRMIVTPLASGQSGAYLLYSASGPDLTRLYIPSAGSLRFRTVVGGSSAFTDYSYTPSTGDQVFIDFSWDAANINLNVTNIGEDSGAKSTTATTVGAAMDNTLWLGSSIGSLHFNATYDSVKFYPNAAAAAADLDDWSIS